MTNFLPTAAATALAAALALAGAADATIVQFAQVSNANLSWTQSTGVLKQTNTAGKAYAAVTFQFDTTALTHLGPLSAGLVLNGTATQKALTANVFGQTIVAQPLVSGSFDIFYEGVTKTIGTLTVSAGDVLLHGVFTGGDLTGINGHTGAAFTVDSTQTAPTFGSVTYTSAFETFPVSSASILSLTASSTASNIGYTVNGKMKSNSGLFSGNFSVDPGPTASIPEPASWALMLVGFGAVGGLVRRRKPALVAA